MYMSKMKIMYDELTHPKTQQYQSSCYYTSFAAITYSVSVPAGWKDSNRRDHFLNWNSTTEKIVASS